MLRSGTYTAGQNIEERWDPELFWSSDPTEPDKTYSKIGGFIKAEFKPKDFRIPPSVATQIDLVQQIALMSADALEDAGYSKGQALKDDPMSQ